MSISRAKVLICSLLFFISFVYLFSFFLSFFIIIIIIIIIFFFFFLVGLGYIFGWVKHASKTKYFAPIVTTFASPYHKTANIFPFLHAPFLSDLSSFWLLDFVSSSGNEIGPDLNAHPSDLGHNR